MEPNTQPAPEGLTVTCHITAADYRAAVHFNLYRKKRYMLPLLVGGSAASVLRITLFMLGVWPGQKLLMWACLFYLVAVLAIYLIAERQIGKYAVSVQSTLGKEQTLVYTEEGIADRTNGEDRGTFRWRAMKEGYETKENFLFFLSDQAVIEQPKSGLTPEQVETIRELASRRMLKSFQVRVKGYRPSV